MAKGLYKGSMIKNERKIVWIPYGVEFGCDIPEAIVKLYDCSYIAWIVVVNSSSTMAE